MSPNLTQRVGDASSLQRVDEALHGLIQSGEIMRRREDNGGGAGIELLEDGGGAPTPVTFGAR